MRRSDLYISRLWCGYILRLVIAATMCGGVTAKAVGQQEPARSARADLAAQIVSAEAVAAARPRDPKALLELAALYDRAGEFKKSLPLLRRLSSLQPGNSEVDRRLGIDLFHSGQPEQALEPLRKAVRANPEDAEANFYLGLCYLALDREDEANKAFQRQAAKVPGDQDELYLFMKGYSGLSSAMLNRLAGLGEDSYRIHEVRGEYFEMESSPALAIKEYEKAVELRPDIPSLHYALGTACWKQNQLDRAAAEFRRTIELAPHHFMAHYKLGMVLLEQNSAEATKEFQAALAIEPGIVNAYLGLGKALFQRGEYEAAMPQLRRYIELAPKDPTPHYLLFQIFRHLNDEQSAQEQLRLFKQKDEKAKAEQPPAMPSGRP